MAAVCEAQLCNEAPRESGGVPFGRWRACNECPALGPEEHPAGVAGTVQALAEGWGHAAACHLGVVTSCSSAGLSLVKPLLPQCCQPVLASHGNGAQRNRGASL